MRKIENGVVNDFDLDPRILGDTNICISIAPCIIIDNQLSFIMKELTDDEYNKFKDVIDFLKDSINAKFRVGLVFAFFENYEDEDQIIALYKDIDEFNDKVINTLSTGIVNLCGGQKVVNNALNKFDTRVVVRTINDYEKYYKYLYGFIRHMFSFLNYNHDVVKEIFESVFIDITRLRHKKYVYENFENIVKTTFTKNEEYLVCNSNYGTTFIYPNGIV